MAVVVYPTGDFRAFGTAIRADVGSATGANYTDGVVGVVVNETFHMHGGIVSVDAGAASTNVDAIGISVSGTSPFAHTPDTAFAVVAGGTGDAVRVEGSPSQVRSPFLWPAGTQPPAIESLTGYDLFVETDTGTGGDEPRLWIYRSACSGGGGPWWDPAAKACR